MKLLNGLMAHLTREAWAMEGDRLEAFFERMAFLSQAVGVQLAALLAPKWVASDFKPERVQIFDQGLVFNGDSSADVPIQAGADPLAGIFDDAAPRSRAVLADGVATIPITGVLMKSVPKIFRYFGVEATSYSEIQADLAAANADPKVTSIRLAIDSPGGQVSGVKETADAIAASGKPVHAVVNDLAGSAAYWLASQAKTITASPMSQTGSIGVYTSVVDSSKAAEDAGFKVHLISSGPHKGMGTPGVPVTDEQLKAAKDLIDGMASHFVADVAAGRGKAVGQVQDWATGRVWLADKAKALGLIDSIGSIESKGAPGVRAAAESATQEKQEETTMAENQKAADDAVAAERAASQKRIADIRAAFQKEPDFALQAIEKGWTLTEAKAAFSDVLTARAEVAAKAPRAPAPAAAAPVATGPEPVAQTEKDFMSLVEDHMKATGCTKLQAMSAMCKKHPKAYADFDLRLAK